MNVFEENYCVLIDVVLRLALTRSLRFWTPSNNTFSATWEYRGHKPRGFHAPRTECVKSPLFVSEVVVWRRTFTRNVLL